MAPLAQRCRWGSRDPILFGRLQGLHVLRGLLDPGQLFAERFLSRFSLRLERTLCFAKPAVKLLLLLQESLLLFVLPSELFGERDQLLLFRR